MSRPLRSLASLVAAAVLVAACADDGPSSTAPTSTAPTSTPAPTSSAVPAPEPDACAERVVDAADAPVIDALLALFAETPIVAFGEHHGSDAEHRILQGLVCDPRFPTTVDVVVVEFGNERLQDVLDRYVRGDDVSVGELSAVWRESTQRSGVWDDPVYRQYFAVVRSVNRALGPAEQVRVFAGDPPIDWSTITATRNCDERDPACLEHWDREENFADVVRREALDHGRTALLIAGAGHMTRRLEPGPPPSIPQLLEADHPGAVAIVLTHERFVRDDPVVAELLTTGPVPALVSLANSPLGAAELCLVDDGPGCAAHTLSDVADHYLYLGGLRPPDPDPTG